MISYIFLAQRYPFSTMYQTGHLSHDPIAHCNKSLSDSNNASSVSFQGDPQAPVYLQILSNNFQDAERGCGYDHLLFDSQKSLKKFLTYEHYNQFFPYYLELDISPTRVKHLNKTYGAKTVLQHVVTIHSLAAKEFAFSDIHNLCVQQSDNATFKPVNVVFTMGKFEAAQISASKKMVAETAKTLAKVKYQASNITTFFHWLPNELLCKIASGTNGRVISEGDATKIADDQFSATKQEITKSPSCCIM